MGFGRVILRNARAITRSSVLYPARVVWECETIVEVGPEGRLAEGLDVRGQWVLPGVVDLHNDGLEKEVNPRPAARLPETLCLHYFDRRLASCGIATEFDALYFSDLAEQDRATDQANRWSRLLERASRQGLCLVEHQVLHRWDMVNGDDIDSLWDSLARW